MRKMTFLMGMGAGYVLGARAGRERYEQIMEAFDSFRTNPKVHETMTQAKDQASHLAEQAKSKISSGDEGSDTTEMGTTSTTYAGSNGRMGL